MPSQIKVDEIKNVAGQYKIKTNILEGQTNTNNMTINAGNITVKSEGTATTNLQKGLAKAWFSQMDQSGQAVDGDTLNFSSYSDPGTGRSEVTVTNIMAATDCCVIGSSQTYDYGHYQVSTSVFRYAAVNSSGTYTDGTAHGLVFGVLA